MRKQCIAMLLAGGRGTRLKQLTEKLAKPAVPYGGKYRIIDFSLSNCINSGIDTVGLLTQYQPHLLQDYVNNGNPWDLNRKEGGLSILPPFQSILGEKRYEGTAHAIYQNIDYIEQFNPEYLLVLSGDHIYKMDYNKMLKQHIQTGADATISVTQVPYTEASRFGIIKTHKESNRISEFEEKPKHPSSNLASMGIYIFNWKVLKSFLEEEEHKLYSTKDFGKDIIPAMLGRDNLVFSYEFQGYWKDVGTLESFWEANIDLLKKETNIFLKDKEWSIYSVEEQYPPQYLDYNSSVQHSLISEGCEIYGNIYNSVLFKGVKIGKGAVIKNSVILPNAIIEDNVYLERCIVGSDLTIGNNKKVVSTTKNEIQLISENLLNQQEIHVI